MKLIPVSRYSKISEDKKYYGLYDYAGIPPKTIRPSIDRLEDRLYYDKEHELVRRCSINFSVHLYKMVVRNGFIVYEYSHTKAIMGLNNNRHLYVIA